MSTETYKTIDKLVRKWSYLFNLDDHHAGKLRKSLENHAECLERKYDPNQCGNYEGYIASCLAKFSGCDAFIALYGERRQVQSVPTPCTSGISPCTGARPLGRRIFGRVFANCDMLEILKRQPSIMEKDEHIVHRARGAFPSRLPPSPRLAPKTKRIADFRLRQSESLA